MFGPLLLNFSAVTHVRMLYAGRIEKLMPPVIRESRRRRDKLSAGILYSESARQFGYAPVFAV